MRKLAWTIRWHGRSPATGSDEWWRPTLVLPLPFSSQADDDGDRHWPALVLVVRPWWLCRDALARDWREYVRWVRSSTAAQYAVFDDEAAWDLVHDAFDRVRPPTPAAF